MIVLVGTTLESLIENVLSDFTLGIFAPHISSTKSWSISMDTIHRTITMEQKQVYRERFHFLSFNGPVRLSQPEIPIWILAEYPRKYYGAEHATIQEGDPSLHSYFGKLISMGGMKEVKYLS